MRLINTQTLTLELFADPVPAHIPYAILSHTWTDDEVSFEDMQDLSHARIKKGFTKIEATCKLATDNGLQYVWVDTCCIDKSSSAELSEAINCMFRWYNDAVVCYAFLADLPVSIYDPAFDELRLCRWFTRGWTLQELVAPTTLVFIDQEWNLRGTKEELGKVIATITGIDEWVLNGSTLLSTIPLARRMSWAAGRNTTRVEDVAYCLLGIFEVNMPMIYGEGSRAFARLQEEILKKTTDLSLFAWQSKDKARSSSILADSPAEFLGCSDLFLSDDQFRFRDEISMTNKGVKLNTSLQHLSGGVYILDLHCYRQEKNGASTRIAICLKRALDTYFRHEPHRTAPASAAPGGLPLPIFLASTTEAYTIETMVSDDESRRICFDFPKDTSFYRVHGIKAVPETYWQAHEQYFSIHGLYHFRCFVRFDVTSRVSPHVEGYGKPSEETTSLILVCDFASGQKLRFSLYAETGLQSSPKPKGFIDPFTDIERYGPLGDPLSFSVLSPGDQEDRRVSIMHRNHRHNYTVVTGSAPTQSPPFQIAISVYPVDVYHTRPGQGREMASVATGRGDYYRQ
jgi:hypothetical protein